MAEKSASKMKSRQTEESRKSDPTEKETVLPGTTKKDTKKGSNKDVSDKAKLDDTPTTPTKVARESDEGKGGGRAERLAGGEKADQESAAGSKKGSKGKKSQKKKKTKGSVRPDPKPQSPMMKRLTDFFPIRRSNRRCKSTIEAEEKKYIEEAIKTGKEEGLKVQEIEGKGRGVVAQRSFRKGQFVVEYHGELIDLGTAKELEEEYGKDPTVGCYMYYFEFRNKRYCINATKESGRLGRLLNHSKAGNCCTKLISIHDKPHLILVAKKDIKSGEELLYDYGDRSKETLESHPWLAS